MYKLNVGHHNNYSPNNSPNNKAGACEFSQGFVKEKICLLYCSIPAYMLYSSDVVILQPMIVMILYLTYIFYKYSYIILYSTLMC